MRLFWISFALLLSANLAHAVKLRVSRTGLAPAPVDNIEGFRCSDYKEKDRKEVRMVDLPKALRESNLCKHGGKDGWEQLHPYLYSMTLDSYQQSSNNKPYLCCLLVLNTCVSGIIEEVLEKNINGKEQNVTSECSNSKSCQDPKKHFCVQEAANNPNHYQRTDDDKLLEIWKKIPVCCWKNKIDETCDYAKSDYAGEEPNDDCETNFGRCKADNHTLLCSKKKHDKTASSCCKPHKNRLCHFGIYPFGLKGKNGLVDWIGDNFGDKKAWKKACIDLGNNPNFTDGGGTYVYNEKCCANVKLNVTEYYGKNYAELLSDQYNRFSMHGCEIDQECDPWGDDSDDTKDAKFCGTITSSYKNEPATGKACFEKIHCPHKTKTIYPVRSTDDSFICTDSSTCPEGAICVWGKPAAATAAKVKKSFGMCCSKAEYETEMCTAEFLGNPLHNKTGLIDPAILTRENCQHFTQKWGTLDTGSGGTGEDKTGVCCQYKDAPPMPTTTTTRSQETEGSDSSANNNLQFHFFPVIFFVSLLE